MKVRPTESKELSQLDLLPQMTPHVEEVAISTITRRTSLLRALHLSIETSGLEDKQIYGALGIDASHWTRIKNGTAALPPDKIAKFMDVVRNEILLIWLAEFRGYDWTTIRKHRSDLERENERLRQKIADQERAIGLIISHQGRK